ncbi:MAG: adenylyltransferase/cytidyltransferase family protein [Flavobacteriia bacterium]
MKRWEYVQNKVVTIETASQLRELYRLKNQKTVFTNGCFDLLHLGHVQYLAQAADLGSKLIVAVNDDASVRSLNKGENRPINPASARVLVLASLGFVDLVVVFSSSTPLDVILALQPDVIVKGGDYNALDTDATSKTYIVGSSEAKSWGGETATIPLVDGYSTTLLLAKK